LLNKLEGIVLQVNLAEQPRKPYQGVTGGAGVAWPKASFGEAQELGGKEWADVAFCLLCF